MLARTEIRFATVLLLPLTLTMSNAFACDSLSDVHDVACTQWAPITGNVAPDACEVATLDLRRAEAALAGLSRPRQPGVMIWSAGFLHKSHDDALARRAQECSASQRDLGDAYAY